MSLTHFSSVLQVPSFQIGNRSATSTYICFCTIFPFLSLLYDMYSALLLPAYSRVEFYNF